ncbi:hypothetical protein [Acidithiobacillus sp. HP-6]
MSVKELSKLSGAHPTTIKGWLARAPYRRRKRAGREAPRSAGSCLSQTDPGRRGLDTRSDRQG